MSDDQQSPRSSDGPAYCTRCGHAGDHTYIGNPSTAISRPNSLPSAVYECAVCGSKFDPDAPLQTTAAGRVSDDLDSVPADLNTIDPDDEPATGDSDDDSLSKSERLALLVLVIEALAGLLSLTVEMIRFIRTVILSRP